MGKKLYDLANDPKFSYFTENDDHMMTFDEQLVNAIKNFLIFNLTFPELISASMVNFK